MLINSYIKYRKHIILIIFLSIFLIFITSNKKDNKNKSLYYYIKSELRKKKLELVEVQNIKTKYNFKYKQLFFIAKKNGLKELFMGNIRVTSNGKLIDLKNVKQITDTPLSDEFMIYSNNKIFIYGNIIKNKKIISIINKNKIIHIFSKKLKIKDIKYNNKYIYINNIPYSLKTLKTIKNFNIYEESISFLNDYMFYNKRKYNNNIKNIMKTYNLGKKEYKYLLDSKISNNKSLPFKYFKIKIPKKNIFEVFFFNKNDYDLKIIDSGGVRTSKTGYFLKNKLIENKNYIYMDFIIKGGFRIKNKLIRPIIINYPTITINGKNNINYGFLKKIPKNKTSIMQFYYPLNFKNNKKVKIENLKINLTKRSQKNKLRTGICFKNNLIGYFQLFGNRNLLTDYLYLINCDYSFETNTKNFSNIKINNSRPKLVFIPKKQKYDKLAFHKYKFLNIYEDELIKIYKIPCNKIELIYKGGISDPLINKKLKINRFNKNTSITLFLGNVDPINPDGLFSNNQEYYKFRKLDSSFIITDLECKIGGVFKNNNIIFKKEGEVIFQNNKIKNTSIKKYQKIISAIGVKNEMIYLYQFKKPTKYNKIFKYNNKISPQKIIIFENYGDKKIDNDSSKLIIQKLKNGSKISRFKDN